MMGLVRFCSDEGEEDEEKKLGMLKTRRRWNVWDKGKSNQWREGDFSTVMDVIRDEGDRELINFQLLVLFFLFRNEGGYIAGVELVILAKLNGWDFIISKVINSLYNVGFILTFK